MKLELKNLKVNKQLSEETTCFSATLYSDGKKVATVANRGCGGPNEYHWLNHQESNKIHEWAKTQSLKFDFEQLDQIVDKLIEQKETEKLCKNKTVFQLKGDNKQEWRVIKEPFGPKIKDWLTNKYGDKLETILNEQSS